MMRIVFFGSDDFAAVHLEQLLGCGHQVLACVTGPDRPQGRGMKIVISPIKQIALNHQIPCLQPLSLKDKVVVDELKGYAADIFVVVAYGRLLTAEVLGIPKRLCLNVHGSLLPKYRGAAPVNWAILNGDKETGVTVQKMALALDAGDIVAQEQMVIGSDEQADQLRGRMALVGAKLLLQVLQQNPAGDFPSRPQDEALVTWAPKLTKEMGRIDWNRPATSIVDQVRGLKPWPGAYTLYNGKILKVTRAVMGQDDTVAARNKELLPLAGQVLNVSKDGFGVACGGGVLLVTEVQPEAGKVMPASSFVAGYKIVRGSSFI